MKMLIQFFLTLNKWSKGDQLCQDELVLDYEEDDLSPLEARRHRFQIRDGKDSQLPMPRRLGRRRKQPHRRCSSLDINVNN